MRLEEQKNTQEEIIIPEAKQEASTVKPEELSEQMTEQSQREVSDLQAMGEKGIEDIEKTLEDGLVIDESDKTELKGLNQEAVMAKNELVLEISHKDESKEKKSEFSKREQQLKLEELEKIAMISNEYIKEHANNLGVSVSDFPLGKIDWLSYSEKKAGVYYDETREIKVKNKANLHVVVHELIHNATSIKNKPDTEPKNIAKRQRKVGFTSTWNSRKEGGEDRDLLRGLNEAVTDKIAGEIFYKKREFLVSDMQKKYPDITEKIQKLAEDKKNFELNEIKNIEEAGEEAFRLDENNLFLMESFEEFLESEKKRVLENYEKNINHIPGQFYTIEDKGAGYKEEMAALDTILDKLAEKRSKDQGIDIDSAHTLEWEDLQKAFFQGNTLYLKRFEKVIGRGTLSLFNEINRKKIKSYDELKAKVDELIEHVGH